MPTTGAIFTFMKSGDESPMLQTRAFHAVLHELFALFIALIGGFFGITLLAPSHPYSNHPILSDFLSSQFNPGFWFPALFAGFAVNYYTRHRSACWIGLLGLAILVTLVVGGQYHRHQMPFWRSAYCDLLSMDDNRCGEGTSFGKMVIVGPVLGSISYSIGSALALRTKRNP